MSQRYATIAATALRADPIVSAWATGGVLDRDPRRSGPGATEEVFAIDENGDINPTIACDSGNAVRVPNAPDRAYQDAVVVRVFAPDHHAFYVGLDDTVARIIAVLFGYRASNANPAQFRWESCLGRQGGGAFEDVVYDEVRFRVIGVHDAVEVP